MPYDVDDTESFFGRDRDIRACLERLEHEGVLAVLGPSGSGKSSLVRAGIVATLARTGRHSDVITPGRHPVGALPPPKPTGKPRLLVVDQAEELFSLCTDPEERERFAQLLADHAAGHPWCSCSGPTGWATSPPTRGSRAWSNAACTSSPP